MDKMDKTEKYVSIQDKTWMTKSISSEAQKNMEGQTDKVSYIAEV